MILADRIRQYVLEKKITPARQQDRLNVTIVAGEIHAEMGLENRIPAVCGALDAEKFLDYASIRLIERRGPRQGSKAEWVFALR